MKYEKIYNCQDDAEAAVILGMLSASGITGMSRDVEQGDIMNVMSGTTLYGKEICVPYDEVEKARSLMKDYDSAAEKEETVKKPKVRIPYLIMLVVFVVAVVLAIAMS